jgi:hypothetical protein
LALIAIQDQLKQWKAGTSLKWDLVTSMDIHLIVPKEVNLDITIFFVDVVCVYSTLPSVPSSKYIFYKDDNRSLRFIKVMKAIAI